MDFTAVVMAAGPGSRMTHLTTQYPKALLPIGNFPMVYYPINMLERHGFQEAIVIVCETYKDEIRRVLKERCNVTMKLDFVGIPDTEDWGTADSLRHVREKISSSNVLVVGCDLLTDLNLMPAFNIFRKHDASVVVLLSKLQENKDLPIPEKVCFGTDEAGERLLWCKAIVDRSGDAVFSHRQMMKYPYVRLRTTLTDCHLYLMKKWVVDYISFNKDCKKMTSLRSEVIPHIVMKQFPSRKRLKRSRASWKKEPADGEPDLAARVAALSLCDLPDIYAFAESSAWRKINHQTNQMAKAMSSSGDGSDLDEELMSDDPIQCYVYIQDSGFCACTNTINTYCEANRQISRMLDTLVPATKGKGLVHPTATIQEKSQIGPDCIVAEGVTVGEKVSVKKSVIGRKCVISDKCKIANSIIMDEVVIGESCQVINTIISSGSQVAEKCELNNSIIGQSMTVAPMSKFTYEVITDVDRMMEV
ncbi:hypothetical protein BaRGS_00013658 [Batillaria attramentaria]|uniref:Translation initiation factor eIF2B subunit gamma n=1 Tax=Batillaria attramentaria TaxID=370345 RepID=A0ABD0L6W0_9CAEN